MYNNAPMSCINIENRHHNVMLLYIRVSIYIYKLYGLWTNGIYSHWCHAGSYNS